MVDGVMTRMPVGYAAFVQGWQPNRSVIIENVGDMDVRNPRIIVNGKRNWHSLADVAAEATRNYTGLAERARAIWEFRRRHRFHATTWDGECSDAVKALCVYGYTLCGDEAIIINDVWKAAGLTTRRGYPVGHCVTEVFYDGAFHLLDSDEHVFCLMRDNRTIASEADVVRDHDLMKRTHTYSIGNPASRSTDEFSASLYGYEGVRKGDYGHSTRHVMDLVLRPNEAIEFRWDHLGKQYTAGTPVPPGQSIRDGQGDLLAGWGTAAHDNLVNGRMRYRPDLSSALARQGAETVLNARFDTASSTIRPVDPRQTALVAWRFASPYVFVGGKATANLQLGVGGSAEWRYAVDDKNWQKAASSAEPGSRSLSALLDAGLSPRGRPTYRFSLQLVLRGNAVASGIRFENDVQMAPLSLPELEVGANRVEYTDASPAGRQVRITHHWMERLAWHPPQPPTEAVAPGNGQEVQGSKVTFRWTKGVSPGAKAIRDYHFELSDQADLRWPLSPNFEKLVSLTPSAGKPEWTVPCAGLLNPGTTYYWRVRACDSNGVWGPWSRIFSFRIQAPGVPLEVKLAPQGDSGLQLQWQANPQGSRPIHYKVYGSDERGFSVSDVEYPVERGKGFVRSIEEYRAKPATAANTGTVKTPANLITQVGSTSLAVVGPGPGLPNKAYYRVVAIDAAGNQSGASDYAEVPRPYVLFRPQGPAQLNKPYRCLVQGICSEGDLRCRVSRESSYNAAFWDREEYRFTATSLPEGIAFDPQANIISGLPKRAGRFEIALKVEDRSGKSRTVVHRLQVVP
jgi:hypothetical protein